MRSCVEGITPTLLLSSARGFFTRGACGVLDRLLSIDLMRGDGQAHGCT